MAVLYGTFGTSAPGLADEPVIAQIRQSPTKLQSHGNKTGKIQGHLSPTLDFAARCDGKTDDSEQLAAWWAAVVATAAVGDLPAATCVAKSPLTWSLAGRPSGVRIVGAALGASVLDLREVTNGTPLLITSEGMAAFYSDFSDFSVLTDIAGPGVRLGAAARTDAFNGFQFSEVEFKNVKAHALAVALQVNGCYNCDFRTITTNTGGGSTDGNGIGVSMELTKVAFSRFQGSFSSGAIGLHITGDYIFGNVFDTLDIENTDVAVQIDSPKAARNTFVGGQFVARTGLNFMAGSDNVLINPNIAPYLGGVTAAGVTGMWLQQFSDAISTPSVPLSGAVVANASGRLISVTVSGGTVSQITVGHHTYALTQGEVIVRPGQEVGMTYSSKPSWTWEPIF